MVTVPHLPLIWPYWIYFIPSGFPFLLFLLKCCSKNLFFFFFPPMILKFNLFSNLFAFIYVILIFVSFVPILSFSSSLFLIFIYQLHLWKVILLPVFSISGSPSIPLQAFLGYLYSTVGHQDILGLIFIQT